LPCLTSKDSNDGAKAAEEQRRSLHKAACSPSEHQGLLLAKQPTPFPVLMMCNMHVLWIIPPPAHLQHIQELKDYQIQKYPEKNINSQETWKTEPFQDGRLKRMLLNGMRSGPLNIVFMPSGTL